MKVEKTLLNDLLIIYPNVFGDDRGYFMESFNKDALSNHIGDYEFVQDN